MHGSEVFQQTMSVIDFNRTCRDPFALKGDGRYLTASDLYAAMTRFREHTFFRATTKTGIGDLCCFLFAEDGYGERRFSLVFWMRIDDATQRWQVDVRTIYLAFQVLGLEDFPIETKWEQIPLPEGYTP